MMFPEYEVRPERSDDAAAIELLHAEAFGPGRFARTAFRIRESVEPSAGLCFVADAAGSIIGSVRLTPIEIGSAAAQLLGPLAVAPNYKNLGVGRALMRRAVAAARQLGVEWILLVGDLPYYAPFGFSQVPPMHITLPGPVDPNRLLIAGLHEHKSALPSGAVRALCAVSPSFPEPGHA